MIRHKVAQNKTGKVHIPSLQSNQENTTRKLDRVPENSDTSHRPMQNSAPFTKGFIMQL